MIISSNFKGCRGRTTWPLARDVFLKKFKIFLEVRILLQNFLILPQN
jgi:hypothetical protein